MKFLKKHWLLCLIGLVILLVVFLPSIRTTTVTTV
jgi:hypothetical protein